MASHPQVAYGSSGSAVWTMQSYLVRLGYSLPIYGVDGIFGSETRRAVINFQANNWLVQDGICGPKTWAALDAAIAKLNQPSQPSAPAKPKVPALTKVTDATAAPAVTSNASGAARTEVQLLINNADVTVDIAKRIISATFTDNEDGESDDFQITLEDSDNAVVQKWLTKEAENRPTTNKNGGKATMIPLILQVNPKGDGRNIALACGEFELDDVTMKGPPQQVTMKGTSLAYASGMRDEKHYIAWENITLLNIAKKIAKTGAYGVMYLTQKEVKYTRKEQIGETDIAFLQKLCAAAGLSLKVTDGTIVIFDKKEYEGKAAVRTIQRGDGSYSTYSFDMKLAQKYYVACHLKYKDDKGVEYEGEYVPPGSEYTTTYVAYGYSGSAVKTLEKYLEQFGYSLDGCGTDGFFGTVTTDAVKQFQKDHGITQDGECGEKTWAAIWKQAGVILKVSSEPVTSNAEARKQAEYKIREANKGEKSGSFTMPGDVSLCAGLTVNVAGFGDFDGKYIIEQSKHSISRSSGYRTTIQLREVITGYTNTGWKKQGNYWYYYDANGNLKTGWLKDNGKWYYLGSNGAMVTGWQKIRGKWYYFNGSGAMQTGWLKDKGKWYYLDGSGVMQTGWVTINRKWYYFNSSGVWIK